MKLQNCKVVSNNVNPDAYHVEVVKRGQPDFVMSASHLRSFGECPSRWLAGYTPPESEAKDWGTLVDALVLTPSMWRERIAVRPPTYTSKDGEVKPWNSNSNTCRQWLRDHVDKLVVTEIDMQEARKAVAQLIRDESINQFINESNKQVFISGEWMDEPSGVIVPVKALLDTVPFRESEFEKSVGDLKTTRNAGVRAWARFCFQNGYHIQAAFYLDMLSAATGEDRNTFVFFLSESYAPYQIGKRMLTQEFLQLGRETYRRLLSNYCHCLSQNRWPGYDDNDEAVQGFTLVNADPWMLEAELFAPRYQYETNAPD